jgi:hypothetical protein
MAANPELAGGKTKFVGDFSGPKKQIAFFERARKSQKSDSRGRFRGRLPGGQNPKS